MPDFSHLLQSCIDISHSAGRQILEIYQRDFTIYEKSDQSPLTEADLAAHKVIVSGLEKLAGYPVLSEESCDISWQSRKSWQTYWLVDPLDGTKEFIKKNGEFTVNIALIHEGKPVLGVVFAPVLQTTYYGVSSAGAYKIENDGQPVAIQPMQVDPEKTIKVVGSRSHQSPDIVAYLDSLQAKTELVAMGSSLKLCLVAEGKAHLYPRLGPTSEWDTGAAHAVAIAAGAKVTVMVPTEQGYQDSGDPLTYNQKESVLNPYFLVSA